MPVDMGRAGAVRRPPTPELWTCPNCAVENTSVLAQGCPVCGAGKPGQKAEKSSPPTELQSAFTAWVRPLRDRLGSVEETLLFEAFKAGWEMAMPAVVEKVVAEPEPLVGTPESRTLRAALQLFIDQVLSSEPEEVVTGEWISAAAARKLLATV